MIKTFKFSNSELKIFQIQKFFSHVHEEKERKKNIKSCQSLSFLQFCTEFSQEKKILWIKLQLHQFFKVE